MTKKADALWHLYLYFGLLVGGFAVFGLKFDGLSQFFVVDGLVAFYLGWGFLYHSAKGDIEKRVFFEYLLVAAIGLLAAYFVLVF